MKSEAVLSKFSVSTADTQPYSAAAYQTDYDSHHYEGVKAVWGAITGGGWPQLQLLDVRGCGRMTEWKGSEKWREAAAAAGVVEMYV